MKELVNSRSWKWTELAKLNSTYRLIWTPIVKECHPPLETQHSGSFVNFFLQQLHPKKLNKMVTLNGTWYDFKVILKQLFRLSNIQQCNIQQISDLTSNILLDITIRSSF